MALELTKDELVSEFLDDFDLFIADCMSEDELREKWRWYIEQRNEKRKYERVDNG